VVSAGRHLFTLSPTVSSNGWTDPLMLLNRLIMCTTLRRASGFFSFTAWLVATELGFGGWQREIHEPVLDFVGAGKES